VKVKFIDTGLHNISFNSLEVFDLQCACVWPGGGHGQVLGGWEDRFAWINISCINRL